MSAAAPGRPRVSVLMAVHDDARFVAAAVDSVLGQDLRDLELLVVDDGSSDGTAEIVAAVADPRLRMLRQDNRGLTDALIHGLEAARGELIARQDADDVSLPARLARQVAYLDAHAACAAVGSWMELIDDDGEPLSVTRFPCDPAGIAATLPHSNQFSHGSLLMRRGAIDAVGGYRSAFRYAQDYDLLLRLSERFELANLPEALYRYRVSAAQISARRTASQAAYAALARRLAAERREQGRDSLERGRSVEDLLEPVPPDPRRDPARQLALYYLRAGRSGKARRQLARLVRGGCLEPRLVLALGATFLGDAAVRRMWSWTAGRRERRAVPPSP